MRTRYFFHAASAVIAISLSSEAPACVSVPLTPSQIDSRIDESIAAGAVFVEAKVTAVTFRERGDIRATISAKRVARNVKTPKDSYEITAASDCSLSIPPDLVGRVFVFLLFPGDYKFFGSETWHGHDRWLSAEYQRVLAKKIDQLTTKKELR